MILSRVAFEAAVKRHLVPGADGPFACAWRDRSASDCGEIDVLDAAAALLAALLPHVATVGETPLAAVTLPTAQGVFSLPLATARAHPLLADWTPATLAGAVAQIIAAGVEERPGPTFSSVHVRETAPGVVSARTALDFRGEGSAIGLDYGAQRERKGVMVTSILNVEALLAIGRDCAGEVSAEAPMAANLRRGEAWRAAVIEARTAGKPH